MNQIPKSFAGLQVGTKPETVMMQEGLTWFRKHHPKAYMTLLD